MEDESGQTVTELLDGEKAIFWVDWRHEDDAIPNECESVLQTGQLSGELVNVPTDDGFEIYVRYKDKRIKVPLTFSAADRHITLCSLNDALSPDYEVRFCIDSAGSDTLAFLPLPTKTWADLEERYGRRVSDLFYKISNRPNLFTDRLPF